MKAVFFTETGSVDKIRYESLDLDEADLKEGEVRLKLLAGGLNHLDLWVIRGLPHLKMKFPHIAGADICAKVVETRSSKFLLGDRVLAYPAWTSRLGLGNENLQKDFAVRGEAVSGLFQESLVLHEKELVFCPEHLSDEEGAALPLALLTAWQMIVEKAGIRPDEQDSSLGPVLVHGAGSGVTHAILELLISFGVKELFVTSRAEEKLRPWEGRGLQVQSFHSGMGSDLKEKLKGRKFARIFDHIGEASFETNIRLLETGGRLVSCGATSGFEARLDLRHLFFRQLQILGSTMGSLQHFQEAIDWAREKSLRLKISKVFSASEVQTAYQLLNSGTQNSKLVLEF
ncbi:MAG: hypothetical protein EA369_07990 [Bradymonadales bacterium]|nr:MAG: hypothetical protein EA369_07990 [Bradymonadales bacterium]